MEKCLECDKEFLLPQQLKSHMKRDHIEAKRRPHQCDLCAKSYLTLNHLRRHKQAIHEGLKYKCELCSKEFTHKSSLKQHVNAMHLHQKNYQCKQCDKKFKFSKSLAVHINVHHNKDEKEVRLEKLRTERCAICKAGFRTKMQLNNHMKSQHSEKLYRCKEEDCDENFSSHSWKALNAHRDTFHPKTRITSKCDHCGKLYYSKIGLKLHVSKEHDGTATRVQCVSCDRTFCNQHVMQKHVKRDHEGLVESFTCDLCPKKFAGRTNLMSHVKHIHEGKRYACKEEDCEKTFADKKSLENHVNLIHLHIKNHVCGHCNVAFLNPTHLKAHIKNIHDVSQQTLYKCEEENCGKTFKRKFSLETHKIKEHHADPDHPWFQCESCDRKYVRQAVLKEHVKSAHGEKIVPCPDCPKMFTTKANLRSHQRVVHLGRNAPRPYTCDICDRQYKTQGKLRIHEKASHSEKTEQCPDCPSKFTTKDQLRAHERKVHLGQKPAKIHKCEFCDYKTGNKTYMETIHRKKHLPTK